MQNIRKALVWHVSNEVMFLFLSSYNALSSSVLFNFHHHLVDFSPQPLPQSLVTHYYYVNALNSGQVNLMKNSFVIVRILPHRKGNFNFGPSELGNSFDI